MNKNAKKRTKCLFNQVDSSLMDSDPEFVDIISNFSQDEVVSSGHLSERERMLSILSVLLGCQGMGEYAHMLHATLNIGIDPIAIKEVVYQATAYLGIGRTHDYLLKTNEIMKEHGISLPLPIQSTTNEETRFDKGLAKQIELFGPQMADRQNDQGLRKNINRWLASNCFGDYYTRNGLNDQEREMITFCFILAQGGCENQLQGHAAGNFGVGNHKEKLYQVVEQCMPYIGYPRSLNAMSIIDEVASKYEK
ncbi:MAG: carboxymuconolactone decarboxylase family protein [Faecalibacillus sp.]